MFAFTGSSRPWITGTKRPATWCRDRVSSPPEQEESATGGREFRSNNVVAQEDAVKEVARDLDRRWPSNDARRDIYPSRRPKAMGDL